MDIENLLSQANLAMHRFRNSVKSEGQIVDQFSGAIV